MLVNQKGLPIGTRVLGFVTHELRARQMMKASAGPRLYPPPAAHAGAVPCCRPEHVAAPTAFPCARVRLCKRGALGQERAEVMHAASHPQAN